MRRLAVLALLTGLTGPAWAQAPGASPEAVTVELRPLWRGHYRPGRYLPLAVTVSAARAVRGRLELQVDGGPTVVFDLDLPAGGRWGVQTAITAHGSAPKVQAFVHGTEADAARGLGSASWQRPPRAQALFGTLPGAGESPHRALEAAATRRTWALDAPVAPGNPLDYDVLDCVVAGRLGPDRIDDRGAVALAEWVRGGGRLVLADPDVLQRVPALDRALFERVEPGEAVAASIPGLPEHFADALRRRGLGVADVVYDAGRRPHHVRFRSGRGAGALLLSPLDTEPARAAYESLLDALAGEGDATLPTLAPRVVGAFPGPSPGGWPRTLLALWLLAVPGLAWWIRRVPRAGLGGVAAASIVAGWLASGTMSPVAELVPIRRSREAPGWLIHLTAARAADCAVQVPDAVRIRPLLQQVAQAGSPQGRWSPADGRLQDVRLARGTRAAWELRGGPSGGDVLTGRMAAGRLLVSNLAGRDLSACLLSWRGRLFDVGAIEAGGVRNLPLPATWPGPLATLTGVAQRAGGPAARVLRAVFYRLPADVPVLLALAPGLPGPAPHVAGATNVLHPTVVIAPVTGAR